jgi:K+-transporting ATPase ATPase C chain
MKHLRPAILSVAFFVVLTGLVFPAVITAISQLVFPKQANGSMIVEKGKVVGSELIGQPFAKPQYFHPRPSAAGSGYDAANSGGTNLGPTSDKLINGTSDGSFAGVKQLAEAYRKENNLPADTILPADAVTRSASGLDPHIGSANAALQLPRVAKARGIAVNRIRSLIQANTDQAFAGVFGDPCVNVLALNGALDALKRR